MSLSKSPPVFCILLLSFYSVNRLGCSLVPLFCNKSVWEQTGAREKEPAQVVLRIATLKKQHARSPPSHGDNKCVFFSAHHQHTPQGLQRRRKKTHRASIAWCTHCCWTTRASVPRLLLYTYDWSRYKWEQDFTAFLSRTKVEKLISSPTDGT